MENSHPKIKAIKTTQQAKISKTAKKKKQHTSEICQAEPQIEQNEPIIITHNTDPKIFIKNPKSPTKANTVKGKSISKIECVLFQSYLTSLAKIEPSYSFKIDDT